MNILKVCLFLLIGLITDRTVHGFTDEEIQLMKNLRTKCMGETGVAEGVIENAKTGNFDGSEALQCYVKCIWVTMTVMDDDGDIDEGVLQVLIPPDMKDAVLAAFEKCKNEGGASACEKAYNINKCIYNTDPQWRTSHSLESAAEIKKSGNVIQF